MSFISGMLEGMFQRQTYSSYLVAEESKHNRAKSLGLKECQQCGYCCLQRPCVPTPEEIKPIADFLGLSIKQLVETYMVVDEHGGTGYFLRWIKEGQEDIAGEYAPADRTFDKGYCIFFNQQMKACKIWPVRPKEARETNCWDGQKEEITCGHQSWGEGDARRFIPDFDPSDDDDEW